MTGAAGAHSKIRGTSVFSAFTMNYSAISAGALTEIEPEPGELASSHKVVANGWPSSAPGPCAHSIHRLETFMASP